MSNNVCRLLADRLQRPIHNAHQSLDTGLSQLATTASRYLAALRRRREDPEREALLHYTAIRLRAMHSAARQYLPEPKVYHVTSHHEPSGNTPTQNETRRRHREQA